jgi:hypothetical protein
MNDEMKMPGDYLKNPLHYLDFIYFLCIGWRTRNEGQSKRQREELSGRNKM